MRSSEYEYQSDFAKKYYSQGREEGREEGHAEGKARALVAVLEARGFVVSDKQRARILSCTDRDLLDQWLARSVRVASVDELLH